MKNHYSLAVLFLFALPASAADPVPVVDRGLPQANLNSVSGESRSNVRWSSEEHGFVGDDFTIGAPGETWAAKLAAFTTPPLVMAGATGCSKRITLFSVSEK